MTWRMTRAQAVLHKAHYRWWTCAYWRTPTTIGAKIGPVSLWAYRVTGDRAIYVGVGLLGRVVVDTGLAMLRRGR